MDEKKDMMIDLLQKIKKVKWNQKSIKSFPKKRIC